MSRSVTGLTTKESAERCSVSTKATTVTPGTSLTCMSRASTWGSAASQAFK